MSYFLNPETFLSKFQERAERVAKKKALVDFNSEGKKKQNYIHTLSPIHCVQVIKKVSWTASWRL